MGGYLDFWQINTPAFTRIDDAQQIYISPTNRAVSERLMFFCDQSSAVMAVTASAGVGKTTVARYLFHSLPMLTHEILMLSMLETERKSGWLLPRFMQYFGVKSPISQEDLSSAATRELLLQCMNQVLGENRKLAILILRAHLLEGRDAFREIDIIQQMQALSGCQVSFVLIGEPRLKQTLSEAGWQSKLTYAGELKPLNKNEVFQYVHFRLQQVGITQEVFTRQAVHQLHVISQGRFSILNPLCENAMMEAYFKKSKQITDAIVVRAGELTLSEEGSSFNVLPEREPSLSVESSYDDAEPEEKPTFSATEATQPRRSGLKITALSRNEQDEGENADQETEQPRKTKVKKTTKKEAAAQVESDKDNDSETPTRPNLRIKPSTANVTSNQGGGKPASQANNTEAIDLEDLFHEDEAG